MDTLLLYALAEHNGQRFRSSQERLAFLADFLKRRTTLLPSTTVTRLDLLWEFRRLGWVRWEDALTLRVCVPIPYQEIVTAVETRIQETGKTPEELRRDGTLLPLLVGLYSEVGLRNMFRILARPWDPTLDWEDWGNWVWQQGWVQRSPCLTPEGGGPLYQIRPPAKNLAADADKAV